MNINNFKTFYIAKGKNDFRKITTYSNSDLRHYHEDMMKIINNNLRFSKFTKAYIEGSSIVKNAYAHQYNDIFILLDIEKFFQNINHKKLLDIFYLEINKNKSSHISKKDCYKFLKSCYCSKKGLPSGLIPYPSLANIYLKSFDSIVYGKLKKLKLENIIYTRYADDLCISFKSTNLNIDSALIDSITYIVEKQLSINGLKLNLKKNEVY